MNALIRTLLHPMQHRTAHAPPSPRRAPLRTGWPSLSVPTGTHRRSSDAREWYPDGPYDPWKR